MPKPASSDILHCLFSPRCTFSITQQREDKDRINTRLVPFCRVGFVRIKSIKRPRALKAYDFLSLRTAPAERRET